MERQEAWLVKSAYRVACLKVRLRALEAVVCCCNSATVGRKILFKVDFYPLANNQFRLDFRLLLPYRESFPLKGQTGTVSRLAAHAAITSPWYTIRSLEKVTPRPPFLSCFLSFSVPCPLIINPETLFLKATWEHWVSFPFS